VTSGARTPAIPHVLILALRTTDPRRARLLAAQISALADLYQFPAFMTQPLTQPQRLSIFRAVFARHLDKLAVVAVRDKQDRKFDPEESRSSIRVTGWAFRLLEMRGPKISAIDERAVALMRNDGMGDTEIDHVAAMLGLLTKRNQLAEPRGRLEQWVRSVGGDYPEGSKSIT
jgi:hypothetical protein